MPTMNSDTWLYYAIVTDTHINADPSFSLAGENTKTRAEALVKALNALSPTLAFVVHLGDMVHTAKLQEPRDPKAFAAAADIFRLLKHPLCCVPGNHDDASLLEGSFPIPSFLTKRLPGRMTYTFEQSGELFICLDGTAPLEREPAGLLTDQEAELLEKALSTSEGVTVFTHYPVIASHVPWVDRLLLYENGEALHRLLARHSPKVRAVFFGHFHNSYTQIRDHVTYIGVGGSPGQVDGGPHEEEPHVAPSSPLSFLLVAQRAGERIVRQVLV